MSAAVGVLSILSSVLMPITLPAVIPAAVADTGISRPIDIVSVTWPKAPPLSSSLSELRQAIDSSVIPYWKKNANISFSDGQNGKSAVAMPSEVPCYGDATVSYMNSVANKYYAATHQNGAIRYLVILTPIISNNCEWAAKSIVGDYRTPFGITILQDNTIPHVITHELGHALGLGHSNLMNCPTAGDHPWSDCQAVDYGGGVDLMSNIDTAAPLNLYHRWRTGALDSSSIYDVTSSGDLTLSAIDDKSGIRGIHIHEGDAVYWVEYRKAAYGMAAGLYLYRSDTPPVGTSSSSVSTEYSPNYTGDSSGDIWLVNLGDYRYNNYTFGSPSAWSFSTYQGGVSVSATPIAGSSDQVSVHIDVAAGVKLQSLPSQAPDLSRFGFTAADFGSLYTVAPVPNGETLLDPTLQLCNANYASEAHRIQRSQISATPLAHTKYQFISSEVVAYENSTWAQSVLSELDSALANCSPKQAMIQKVKYLAPNGVASRSFLYLSPAKAATSNLFATFQVRGNILVATYQVASASFTSSDIAKWQRLSKTLAGRLLAQNVNS